MDGAPSTISKIAGVVLLIAGGYLCLGAFASLTASSDESTLSLPTFDALLGLIGIGLLLVGWKLLRGSWPWRSGD